MYKVGDIFGLDDKYSDRARFCNENGLMIVEITGKGEKDRRFQIQEVPPPTAEELKQIEIQDLKRTLEKYKEDVEQVELFGMERADYEEKKRLCAEMIIELRKLEKVVQNG